MNDQMEEERTTTRIVLERILHTGYMSMTESMIDPVLIPTLLGMQRGEITEHHIYKKIAATEKVPHNKEL